MATLINREACRTIRIEMNEALAEIAKKHGFLMEIGNMSFSDTSIKAKVEFTSNKEDGATSPREQKLIEEWELYKGLPQFKFTKELKIGDKLRIGGKTHTFKGFDSRKRKFSYITTSEDGKMWKNPHHTIEMALNH